MSATQESQSAPWERISKHFFSTRRSIHVLVGPTADAAAALLSLTYLMRVFLFQFKVHPTTSYEELKEVVELAAFAQESERVDDAAPYDDDLFILVGLGAAVDLQQYFDFTRQVVVVLDSQRPFQIQNLRREDGERLLIWGSLRIHEEIDSFFRRQRIEEVQQRRRRHRRRALHARRRARIDGASHGGDEDEDEDVDNEDELSDASLSSDTDAEEDLLDDDTTPSQSQERIDWLREGDSTEEAGLPAYMEALYYSCSCAGRSSAVEVYDLAVLLHRFSDSLLWHAAIGVCDLYQRRLIDYSTYLVEMGPLQEAVSLQQSLHRSLLQDRTSESLNTHRVAPTNSMQLSNQEEEQLYLLRHSTLWDAIWFDPLVASALDLHHVEDGRPRLSQLLASRCGVSVAMAKRPWREVPVDVAAPALRRVQAELQSLINRRGNLVSYRSQIRSISRRIGYSVEVSSFDACKLFTAVLAAVPSPSLYQVESPIDGPVPTMAEATKEVKQRLERYHRQQFWKAYAVLDIDPNEKLFHEALAEALSLQQFVADATGSMLQPGMTQSTSGLHYAQPSDASKTSPALESFFTVKRLGVLAERLFLTLSMCRRGTGTTVARRPLIITGVVPPIQVVAPTGAAHASQSPLASAAALSTGGSVATPSTVNDGTLGPAVGTGAVEDSLNYLVVLAHSGNSGPGLNPVTSVYRFEQCVHDEHFSTAPRQIFIEQHCVLLKGREDTTYLAERMVLLSAQRFSPRYDLSLKSAMTREDDLEDGEGVEEDEDDDDDGAFDYAHTVEVL